MTGSDCAGIRGHHGGHHCAGTLGHSGTQDGTGYVVPMSGVGGAVGRCGVVRCQDSWSCDGRSCDETRQNYEILMSHFHSHIYNNKVIRSIQGQYKVIGLSV